MRSTVRWMMAALLCTILGATLVAAAPDDRKGGSAVTITPSVSAVMKHVTKEAPPPKTAGKDALAAQIDLHYPELVCTSGQNAAVPVINQALQKRLLALLEGLTPTTVDQLLDAFLARYEQSFAEDPESLGAWSLKFGATIRHADEDLLCVETIASVFLGGAHPNSEIAYLVFSLKTGEMVPLTALLPAAKMGELTRIAEKQFRQVRQLKADETYEQAGFQFAGNRFALNQNFLCSKAGLAFCFNQYEIGPYAMGVTELVIPWSDLETVVDPKGPAGRFLKTQP